MEFQIDLAGFDINSTGFYAYLLGVNIWIGGRNLFYIEYSSGLGWMLNILFIKIDLRHYHDRRL